jgi:O-acetyl-ADP-ribose deacetylase (regulator of RNase III)
MIEFITGKSIFTSEAMMLVNPVNTMGVMGKGLALEFKRKFPDMFFWYADECRKGNIVTGQVSFWADPVSLRYICQFPTKEHWRLPSRLEYIERGLDDFVNKALEHNIESVAFPMIGCGLGGLHFKHQVLPLLVKMSTKLPIPIEIYVAP